MRGNAAASPVPRWRARLALGLYCTAWVVALPLAMLYLLWRSRAQPAYRQHWRERFGLAAAPAERRRVGSPPGAPVIWIHAVSVGETRAAQPVIEGLLNRYPAHRLLLTHMTPTGRETGYELFVERYAPRISQAYLPYDLPWFMDAFFTTHRPELGLIMETELWPGLVAVATRRQVPLVILNARLSEKSLVKGMRFRSLLSPAMQGLSLVLAQTREDVDRMRRLGPVNAEVLGNLKFDVQPKPALLQLGTRWRQRLGRPVVVLASSRDGEEAAVLQAWCEQAPAEGQSAPILVVVPRHPQRFDEVRAVMQQSGLAMTDRAAFDQPALSTEARVSILLGDSMGEMPAWYSLADVVIMGGSLIDSGGQNLIEPCACGAPVVIGPSTYNFELAAEQALQAGAARRVDGALQAVRVSLALIASPDERRTMADNALAFANAHRGATEATLSRLAPFLSAA